LTLRPRVESIDVLRGIVMVLMALDHVRDYFGIPANPTDPARAGVALFFTRWITHLCAPTFFALTGVAAYLARRRRPATDLSRYLLIRGAWLVVLEVTVLRCLGYTFNFDYRVTFLSILWALGWSMIALSALVYLPASLVGWFGVVMMATHNLFDAVRPASFGALAPLWSLLHVPGVVVSTPRFVVFAAYPLIPWIGVTAAGYGFGPVFEWPAERRRRWLLRAGLSAIALFFIIRAINIYGDRLPWTVQASSTRTMLSFLNATKYPPSLLYLLMTLGPAMLMLRALDGRTPSWLGPARVFGSVPLFYFIVHLPLIHLLAVVACAAQYRAVHWMFESPRLEQFPVTFPPGWGFSLPAVYAVWALVVIAMYPLCRWFAGLKQRQDALWLRYL